MNRCTFRCFKAEAMILDLKAADPESLDPEQDPITILKTDLENLIREYKGKFQWTLLSLKDADLLTAPEIHIMMDVFRSRHMKLIDVPASMYDGIMQTGIYGRFEVLKKLRRINTEELELVGEGYTSKVYRYGDGKILKAFIEEMPFDNILDEREKSRFLFMNGARAPIPYELVVVGKGYGVIFENLGHENLIEAFLDGKSDNHELAKKYGALLKQISVPVGRDGMTILPNEKKQRTQGVHDCEDLVPPELLEKVYAELKKVPGSNHLLHGDAHVENIMIKGNELFLIDAMTLAKGHPIFDLLCPYMSFCIWPEYKEIYDARTPEDEKNHPAWYGYISRYEDYVMSREEGVQLWKDFLHGYFGDRDETFFEQVTAAVRILNEIKFGCYIIRKFIPEDMMWGYNHWAMTHFAKEEGINTEIFSQWD